MAFACAAAAFVTDGMSAPFGMFAGLVALLYIWRHPELRWWTPPAFLGAAVSIYAIVMMLVLPYVAQRREIARRDEAMRNLKQIGVALHQSTSRAKQSGESPIGSPFPRLVQDGELHPPAGDDSPPIASHSESADAHTGPADSPADPRALTLSETVRWPLDDANPGQRAQVAAWWRGEVTREDCIAKLPPEIASKRLNYVTFSGWIAREGLDVSAVELKLDGIFGRYTAAGFVKTKRGNAILYQLDRSIPDFDIWEVAEKDGTIYVPGDLGCIWLTLKERGNPVPDGERE
jgi:hypothetical protein